MDPEEVQERERGRWLIAAVVATAWLLIVSLRGVSSLGRVT